MSTSSARAHIRKIKGHKPGQGQQPMTPEPLLGLADIRELNCCLARMESLLSTVVDDVNRRRQEDKERERERNQSQVVAPQAAPEKTLPPVEYAWWDPRRYWQREDTRYAGIFSGILGIMLCILLAANVGSIFTLLGLVVAFGVVGAAFGVFTQTLSNSIAERLELAS